MGDVDLRGEDRSYGEQELQRRASEIFDAIVDLDARARSEYIDLVCRDDPILRREVESLPESLEGARTSALFPRLLGVDEPRAFASGERIGPYTLAGEIGEGGMGVVYRAIREDVGTTVALKLVRHGRLASPVHVRRFLLERRVLGRLEHPNIARLLDAWLTDSGLPYLVMEYVDGEPLDRYCDAHRLTVEERLALFCDACEAAQYAHRHLVVHRDLKPGNILVTREGAVKLLDFGIAALLDDGAGSGERGASDAHRHGDAHAGVRRTRAGQGRAGDDGDRRGAAYFAGPAVATAVRRSRYHRPRGAEKGTRASLRFRARVAR